MKPMTKSLALIAAASGIVFGVVTPLTASATSGPAPKSPKSLKWTKCEGTGLDPRQQCATVEVPMDYADPDGPTIDVAVSRIPSEKPSARRGALLLIPGGPGGSSLNNPSGKGQQLPQKVRDAYDLIGFAPRGLAPSTSVDCGLERRDLALTATRPWPAPDGSITENLVTAKRMSDACARNGGELIQHLSSVNEARDLDRIRAALGERKISAWGVSYGTYVGSIYNELFPHRTDRIVLDSNDNPDPVRVQRAWLAAFERGVEDVFPEFAKWASAPGNPHRLAETPAKVRADFLSLTARLDREPIPWPGANPPVLNGNELRQAMLSAMYDTDDFPGLAQLILAARKGTVPPAPPSPPEEALQNLSAVAIGTICNDADWPASADAYRDDVAKSRAEHPLTAGMPRNAMICAAWPYEQREAPVRITDRGPSNVLLVQNERDVATPLTGALKLRAALGKRAVMVVNDATGHGAYLDDGTACGDEIASRFLATGERPRKDTYCN
ncbi:alpha/beta hydrolase [Streptomyces sp. GESEQ-4]|uniref:alpha/beta hydrolase n=1 Tax=Streptomyces sp. GESEQ-4 TaxID=2812655 RepID=UPI001B31CBC5|nr:alpha/beta hydrolase [Streptomyces sp. GESEQ-4]